MAARLIHFTGASGFSYKKDVKGYIEGIENHLEIIEEEDEIASFYRPAEYIMLGLRTSEGIDEDKFFKNYRLDFSPFADRLKQYEEMGYVKYDFHRWRLTEKGYFVSNTVISQLLLDMEKIVELPFQTRNNEKKTAANAAVFFMCKVCIYASDCPALCLKSPIPCDILVKKGWNDIGGQKMRGNIR